METHTHTHTLSSWISFAFFGLKTLFCMSGSFNQGSAEFLCAGFTAVCVHIPVSKGPTALSEFTTCRGLFPAESQQRRSCSACASVLAFGRTWASKCSWRVTRCWSLLLTRTTSSSLCSGFCTCVETCQVKADSFIFC